MRFKNKHAHSSEMRWFIYNLTHNPQTKQSRQIIANEWSSIVSGRDASKSGRDAGTNIKNNTKCDTHDTFYPPCCEISQFMNIQCFQNIGTILKFCSDSARTEVEIEFLF